jgi:hypothetical protein
MKDIKDTNEIIPPFEARTNPFGDNISGAHAYRRIERIVSALYLVTNHIPHDEPLRREIRSIGHDMLSEVMATRSGFHASEKGRMATLSAQIREAISLVRLLQIAGYVSSQNVLILTQALDELGQYLAGAQHSSLSDGLQLSRDDFIPADRPMLSPHGMQPRRLRQAPAQQVSGADANAPERKVAKAPGRSVQTEVHSERRTLITDILAKSGPLGIKDISMQMVGCSEKTVQRELSVLIQQNKVKKQGEKRWSNYSLVGAQ